MKLKLFLLSLAFIGFVQAGTAQEITMFPGFGSIKYYQDFERISKQEVNTLMLNVPEAAQSWKKSKNHMAIAWIAFGAEIGFLAWQLNSLENNEKQTIPLIGVLGSAVASIGFSISSGNQKKKAILQYNKSKDISMLNLGATCNGLGIVFTFN